MSSVFGRGVGIICSDNDASLCCVCPRGVLSPVDMAAGNLAPPGHVTAVCTVHITGVY